MTGCMCGVVSCQTADMWVNMVQKNKLLEDAVTQRRSRHHVPPQHRFTVGLNVCVQAQSAGWGHCKCRLSSSYWQPWWTVVPNCMSLCVQYVCVCVCVCVLEQRLQPQQGEREREPAGSGVGRGREEVGRWRKWSQRFEGETSEGRQGDFKMWVIRKWRPRRQITLCATNYPTRPITYTSLCSWGGSVLYPGVERRLQHPLHLDELWLKYYSCGTEAKTFSGNKSGEAQKYFKCNRFIKMKHLKVKL